MVGLSTQLEAGKTTSLRSVRYLHQAKPKANSERKENEKSLRTRKVNEKEIVAEKLEGTWKLQQFDDGSARGGGSRAFLQVPTRLCAAHA